MADVPARLKEARQHLVVAGPPPGRAWCHAWASEVDAAVNELAAPAVERHRIALAAVGGYGRRELAPHSDVDLLIVHDGLAEHALEAAVREVVYPLWDAGLEVGYAVRDRRETVAAVDAEVDTATAMLDARTVAGDHELLRAARDAALERLRRKPSRFLTALTEADAARRRRAGDAAEVLEPDLKSGAGGLRDVQSLRWAAAVLLGEVGLDPLVPAGYLGADDRPRLARAEEVLLAGRVALHLELPRPGDVLRFDVQRGVAARLGYEDGSDDRDTAAHRLLRDLFLAARTVDHVHRRAWRLVAADAVRGRRRRRPTERTLDDFEVADGVVRLSRPEQVDEPDLPVRLLATLVSTDGVLDRRSASLIRRAAEREAVPWRWDDASRGRFLTALWQGERALPALAELDDVGAITALIPEWVAVRGRAQRNPFHRYSLDRHGWHAAARLGDLVRDEAWALAAFERVEDRDALMLGVLLHDVGKAHGEPHSETGVPVARAVVRRLGGSAATEERVAGMVRDHLLLPDLATKRDITDPAVAHEVAALVGDAATLARLHLLAAADGAATGPSAWTGWKAALVASLVTKVQAVLDERNPDEVGDGAVVTARDAEGLAPELGVDPAVVRDHLARLPSRYAAAVSARAVVRQAAACAVRPQPSEIRTRVTPGEDGPLGLDELDVIAIDAPGLFATVAGVVTLHGGSIVAADAFTRDDGVAVDRFAVRAPDDAVGSWWVAVEGDIAEAAVGRLALSARVARKARAQRRRVPAGAEVATTVTLDLDPSGDATIVEVHTLDRPGVLYRIAAALAELHLDIVVARIQTLGHEVVDVFYVHDVQGRPLDPDHSAEVELAVRAVLED